MVQSHSLHIGVVARRYRERGFALARIRSGQKRPTASEWTTRSAEPDEFQEGDNIGIQTGFLSSNLVCIDLDSMEAVRLASEFLPETQMIDGRVGKPKSHWWYRVTNVPEFAKAKSGQASEAAIKQSKDPGPKTIRFSDPSNKVILEFRGTGGQAVVPPSLHNSGEQRVWEIDGEPLEIPYSTLIEKVEQLATKCGWAGKRTRSSKPKASKDRTMEPTTSNLRTIEETTSQVQEERIEASTINIPMKERVEMCREYLLMIPDEDLPRSGKRGHDSTFRIARLIVNDFAITDESIALGLLSEFNARLAPFNDQWDEVEMKHKITEALSIPSTEYLTGRKLQDAKPYNPNDPGYLATRFRDTYEVRWWKGGWYLYQDGRYQHQTVEEIKNLIGIFLSKFLARQHQLIREESDRKFQHYLEERRRYDEARTKEDTTELREPKAPKRPKPERTASKTLKNEVLDALQHQCDIDIYFDGTRRKVELGMFISTGERRHLVSVRNGLLDPKTRELLPSRSDYFTLTHLEVEYRPDSTAPQWIQVVGEILDNDQSLINILQEMFGYVLLDSSSLHKGFIFYGQGGNGKSTVLAGLEAMLGKENVSSIGLERFADRFSLVGTLGKLANIIRDANEIEKTALGTLKAFISGDELTFERKNEQVFSSRPTAKLILACNAIPRFPDRSEGIWRRFIMIPFERSFKDGERTTGLDSPQYWKDAEEVSGILNWALEGLNRLLVRGEFTHSPKCQLLLEDHRQESNPALAFLLENYSADASSSPIASSEIYMKYVEYCAKNGHKNPLSSRTFGKEVGKAFPEAKSRSYRGKDRRTQQHWFGISDVSQRELEEVGDKLSHEMMQFSESKEDQQSKGPLKWHRSLKLGSVA